MWIVSRDDFIKHIKNVCRWVAGDGHRIHVIFDQLNTALGAVKGRMMLTFVQVSPWSVNNLINIIIIISIL